MCIFEINEMQSFSLPEIEVGGGGGGGGGEEPNCTIYTNHENFCIIKYFRLGY